MSQVFNDTSTYYKGIVQQYEKEIGANQGDISGNTQKLKEFTADANLAFDDFTKLALEASGTWQWDDSNQTDLPFATTNIVSGQRDYAFTLDGSSNLILEIEKVAILTSATATTYQELEPIDAQSTPDNNFIIGNTTTGTPGVYDKTGNAISLDPIPGYNATNGLKVFFSREASYFVYTDTAKKPGVPGIFHRWFAIRPAEDYARRNSLTNYPLLRAERMQMEKDIEAYFGRREKDVRHRITTKGISFR